MTDIKKSWPEMKLTPVGRVQSEIKIPVLLARDSGLELREQMEKLREDHKKMKHLVSELIIFPRYEELLDGVEGFSHVLVLYWPHLIDPERRNLKKVHPMGRKDLPQQGIFATCSPARPNPILVSAVRLIEHHGNILKVEGLDAVDGSPIIDIKPYSRNYYGAENPTVPDWMAQIQRELALDD
ncbi:MAG: tRNA (N6-threonylcarbamoyladenosine(37)-N6)-methyltransferase TrmO [Deltaproteobacteria bacterium]|nr:tRNA (N6-threonylcarbamoyladenosine(37)-N6)-methyltransferase TrmO [Deltaproteobacteria bacterium]